jgi:hypothetical protein
VPERNSRELNNGGGATARSSETFSQYRRLGSRKITGSSQAIACWIIQ